MIRVFVFGAIIAAAVFTIRYSVGILDEIESEETVADYRDPADNAHRAHRGEAPRRLSASDGTQPILSAGPVDYEWVSGPYVVGTAFAGNVADATGTGAEPDEQLAFAEAGQSIAMPPFEQELNGTVAPGLYMTDFYVENCSYELWSELNDGTRIIAEEYLERGRVMVTINDIEPDWFTSNDGCGKWAKWSPLPTPTRIADNGDYWGADLANGEWRLRRGCRWEKVLNFRGADLSDVIQSGNYRSNLVIDDQTRGVRIRGCEQPIKLAIVPQAS